MKTPRFLWLWIYLLINIVSYLLMVNSGEMIGDFAGYPIADNWALFWSLVGVLGSYFLILGPFFNLISRIEFNKIYFKRDGLVLANRFGPIILVLQILFAIFNLIEGVNIAGSGNERASGLVSFFWIFVPVDVLFLIYYSFFRESKFFFANLIVWLVSNVMRGWAGVFFVVIFFESVRYLKNKKFSFYWALIGGFSILVIYPVVNVFKWTMRGYSSLDVNDLSLIKALSEGLSSESYLDLVLNGLEHIVGRIQTVSALAEVYRIRDVISAGFYNGEFIPFWKEGLLGIAYDTIINGEKGKTLGVVFPLYDQLGSSDAIGNWNLNTSFLSWLVILPEFSFFYALQLVFVCLLSVWFYKMIPGYQAAKLDGLWFAWLVYLMPPWWAAFTGYVYCLFLFIVFFMILDNIHYLKINIKII